MIGKEGLTWTKILCFIFALTSVAVVTGAIVILCMNTNDGTDAFVYDGNATQVFMPVNFSPKAHKLSNLTVHMVTTTTTSLTERLDAVYPNCGGLVTVPMNSTAYIAYKNGSFYTDDERCVWIVTSEARYVQFKFIQEALSSIPSRARSTWANVKDGITVGIVTNGNLTCLKLTRYDYKTPMTLATPFLLYFTSNGFLPGYMSWHRTGFVLQLQSHMETGFHDTENLTRPRTFITSRSHGELQLNSTPVSSQDDLSVAVFTSSLSSRASVKKFSCLPGTTGGDCCSFVSGFYLKTYHGGDETCTRASSLTSSQSSIELSSEDAFVVLFHPPPSVNASNCKLTWM